MYVTYSIFKNDELLLEEIDRNCFINLFEHNWDTIILKIKTSKRNKNLKNFWLDLMIKIEPSIEIINNKKYGESIQMPYLGSTGKTLFILSLIRYLWENRNYYDEIVGMTYQFLNKYPDVDILKAIIICSSNTTKSSGWGHSIVLGMAKHLPEIKDYNIFNNKTCHFLCNPSDSYYDYTRNQSRTLQEIRELKKDDYHNENNIYNFNPILEHYNLNYERK